MALAIANSFSSCSRSAGSPCCPSTSSPSHFQVPSGIRMQRPQPINRSHLSLSKRRSPLIMRSFAAYGDSLLSPGYEGLDLASQLASSAVLTGCAAALAYLLSLREAAYQVSNTIQSRLFASLEYLDKSHSLSPSCRTDQAIRAPAQDVKEGGWSLVCATDGQTAARTMSGAAPATSLA